MTTVANFFRSRRPSRQMIERVKTPEQGLELPENFASEEGPFQGIYTGPSGLEREIYQSYEAAELLRSHGVRTHSVVPFPGVLSISSEPPIHSARSRIPISPWPPNFRSLDEAASGSNPFPLSSTVNTRSFARNWRTTSTFVASECLMTLFSAS